MVKNYTPAGIKAIEQNMQVVSPPVYLTGYLEFQDVLGKNLSEAYVGQLPAKDVLKKTTDEWNAIVNRIGQRKLKDELASYKALMPKQRQAGRVSLCSRRAAPSLRKRRRCLGARGCARAAGNDAMTRARRTA